MERELQRLNWLIVRKLVPAKINTVILPVGTTEAHGSACMGTDNYIPEAIAAGIAERINALIAPTVAHGITKSLYRYPGSSGVQPDTFVAYVRDILDSYVVGGFRNVIVLNGHGGNNGALKEMAVKFHQERQANIAVIQWWELCVKLTEELFGHVGGHGGTDETAMVQAIDPSLVDWEAYDPEQVYKFEPGAYVYPVPGTILLYKDNEGYPENDVERSRQYMAKVIEQVGDFVEMVLAKWRGMAG